VGAVVDPAPIVTGGVVELGVVVVATVVLGVLVVSMFSVVFGLASAEQAAIARRTAAARRMF